MFSLNYFYLMNPKFACVSTHFINVGVVAIVTVGLASDLFGVFLSNLSEEADPVLSLCGRSPEYPLTCLLPASTDLGLTLNEVLLFSPQVPCLPNVLLGVLPLSVSSGFVFLGLISVLKIIAYI